VRIAIIADIHSNIEALEAMYKRLIALRVDSIVCAGDIVGYGASPRECLDFIRSNGIPSVCGSHEYYTLNPEYEDETLRLDAREVFDWNRQNILPDQLEWMKTLPMELDFGDFTICHATCNKKTPWKYLCDARAMKEHFLAQRHSLCFTAHTHLPVIATFRSEKQIHVLPLQSASFLLPQGFPVMVGVGAVGQPRDEDPRACAVLYDMEHGCVSVIRQPYDVKSARERIIQAGLPEFLGNRLVLGI